jgi:hypothetical protein
MHHLVGTGMERIAAFRLRSAIVINTETAGVVEVGFG